MQQSTNNDPIEDEDGSKYWRNALGEIHRDNDLPAIIHKDGACLWFTNGRLNRGNGRPAIIHANGRKLWFIDGQQQSLPLDRPWTYTDHGEWHGRDVHFAANEYLATFLMAYNRLFDTNHWERHDSVIEDAIKESGITWRTLMF
jgi:hypothetical protein